MWVIRTQITEVILPLAKWGLFSISFGLITYDMSHKKNTGTDMTNVKGPV